MSVTAHWVPADIHGEEHNDDVLNFFLIFYSFIYRERESLLGGAEGETVPGGLRTKRRA